MHISDGVLPSGVLIAGWILTALLMVVSIVLGEKEIRRFG